MALFNVSRILFLSLLIILFAQNCIGGKSKLIDLDEDNWHEMMEGEWMVEFFAPWCPACKALKPIWEDFASWSDDLGISVGQVDVTSSPGLSGRFMVTALPTIFHVRNGVFRQYRGPREKDELMNFIEEKKWEKVEEISMWKSPGSYQMAIVAQFFKLSMVLRNAHTSLVDDHGLPTWASYLTFAIATVLIGALLGLVLVCIIDLVIPPKMSPPKHGGEGDMNNATSKSCDDDDDDDLTEENKADDDGVSEEKVGGAVTSEDPDHASEVRQRPTKTQEEK